MGAVLAVGVERRDLVGSVLQGVFYLRGQHCALADVDGMADDSRSLTICGCLVVRSVVDDNNVRPMGEPVANDIAHYCCFLGGITTHKLLSFIVYASLRECIPARVSAGAASSESRRTVAGVRPRERRDGAGYQEPPGRGPTRLPGVIRSTLVSR